MWVWIWRQERVWSGSRVSCSSALPLSVEERRKRRRSTTTVEEQQQQQQQNCSCCCLPAAAATTTSTSTRASASSRKGEREQTAARARERERAKPLPKSAESVALVFLGCPFTFLAPGRLLRRQSRLSIDFNVQPNMSLSLVAAPPQHMAESGGSSTPVPLLATVPAPPGTKRLHFCWGLGNRISLCPLVESPSAAAGVDADDFDAEPGQHYSRPAAAAAQAANAEPPSASVVQWCV